MQYLEKEQYFYRYVNFVFSLLREFMFVEIGFEALKLMAGGPSLYQTNLLTMIQISLNFPLIINIRTQIASLGQM